MMLIFSFCTLIGQIFKTALDFFPSQKMYLFKEKMIPRLFIGVMNYFPVNPIFRILSILLILPYLLGYLNVFCIFGNV